MNQSQYLVIDTEATGLYLNKCGLIQLACISLDKELTETDRMCIDVCPSGEYEVFEDALRINGFSQERIYNGVSYHRMCEMFLEFLQKNFANSVTNSITKPTVIAQFYPFDYAFVQGVFASCNKHLELSEYITNDFLDTKVIVNFINLQAVSKGQPKPFPITSLSKTGGLKDTLGLSQLNYSAHDALGDCLATVDVLKKLIEL